MSEFQTVKRRGHSQNANAKYPEQHQQLVEMGFESSSVSRALDASNGDMEAATAVLIGEGSHKNETEEKVVPASKERKAAASTVSAPAASTAIAPAAAPKTARQSSGLAVVAAGQSVKDIKETHQRMIATYKVQKCKETGAHDRKMCMHYHSLSDRRRNPFDTLYSCYECPNTVDGGECPDGDSCMHSHTMLERMFHPELYKISVCQRQLTGNKCDRAMLCAFAHNDADLRISPSHLTTKYAMQEEAKTTPVPVNQSAMLDHIRINLVKLIKEHGSEGVIAADLPKYYQGKFHESLDIIDESGKKYKLKDLIGPHNNIHVVLTGQPKFVYGDPSIAAAAAESQGTVPTPSTTPRETSQTSSTTTASSQTVKDRVVELIKAAGAEGILATEMSKKYQERYGEKLEKDWNVGLNTVAGMVLTQTKQYTKYTFNAITAGIKDAALPSVIATKDGKAVSNSNAASSKAPVASAPPSAPAQPTASSQSAPKWGSNAGKSFASILSAQGAAAAAAVASTPTVVEAAVVEAPKVAPVEAAPVPPIETKTAAPSPAPVTSQKASKTEKVVNEKVSKSTNGAKLETKTVQSSETSEKDIPVETVAAPPTPLATSDNLVGTSLTTVSSPSSSVGLVLGASPSVSRGTSDIGTLPKPLFGGLDSQLNGTGLDDQFSLGLGSGGSSSLLDLASASLSGILPSSFDLPLEGMDLGANSVLPPGLSKAIGKPTGASPGAPSLSSILGQSFSGGSGLGGLPLTSSSRDTPERNASSGTLNNVVANGSTMTQAERLAYLERELATKTQEADAHAAEVSMLRARVNELESSQLNHDERLRSSIMEKDMELLTKHQEIVKYEDDLRKSKEEKLVDLDQYFIYFSKIEEVINSMKCKEEAFSEKIKPDDVQELFQFKKLMRNYVANVKAQLKNKFDAVVAQTHLMRGSSGNAVVKDPSVEAVALGMVLPSGPPPGGLNASTSGVSSAGTASSSASTGVFGVLSSGASATGVTNAGTSRFAGSFDTHSMPFAHNHHHGLTNVGDAFSSSSVLFPTVTDLGVATTTAAVTKQCGLPGCLKEGLYTCAGCRKISYCGEAHQRSHWGQHSQNCYAR